MRSVVFFRHGKSDWEAGQGDDHERPLANRGRKAARLMGRFLAHAGEVPDLVLTSTAARARTTAEFAAAAGAWGCALVASRDLYQGGPEAVLRQVRGTAPEVATLLLVGHEPTFSERACRPIGGGRLRLPTAAAARIDFDVDRWEEVSEGKGELAWLVTPRVLKNVLADG